MWATRDFLSKRGVTLLWRNLTNAPNQVIEVTAPCHTDGTCPSHDVRRRALHFCGLPGKNPQPPTDHEKNVTQFPAEGQPTKHLTVLLKTATVIKNKESLINCHSQGDGDNVPCCPDAALAWKEDIREK